MRPRLPSTTLVLVAVASGALGFLAARYTAAPRGTAAAPLPAAGAPPPAVVLPDFADIAERANPAVVGITASNGSARSGQQGDPFHWFFGPGQRSQQRSMGSGFLVSSDGFVFTNHHVIEDSSRIEVELTTGERLPARVVGQDPETDLALLKIETAAALPTLPLGDSDRVRVGEWVCAIGNPLLYDHTVTVGVISAKGRVLGQESPFESYLQTDAAINVGNSGGPLLNARGEVIGINTAISAQGQNIGFAIPINMASEVLPQLKERGRVSRGYLGVDIEDVDEATRKQHQLPSRHGVLVSQVVRGEAADRAGLKAGDVILAVDAAPVADRAALVRRIAAQRPGGRVRLTVFRDGREHELVATLGERRAPPPEPPAAIETRVARLGIEVAAVDRRMRTRYRLAPEAEGVVVTEVDEDGPAGDGRLREGDVLTEVNRQRVRDVGDVAAALAAMTEGEEALLYVLRDRNRVWVSVPAEAE